MSHICFDFCDYKNCNAKKIVVDVLVASVSTTGLLVAKALFSLF